MAVKEEIELKEKLLMDRFIYGISIEHQKEDGTIERIDPTKVKIVVETKKDQYFPLPDKGCSDYRNYLIIPDSHI